MVQAINNQKEFTYKAVRIKQTKSGEWLVLFAASAIEIDMWAGIPQKKKLGDQETTGFQREENKKRIREIEAFYKNESNVVQNPLLCALRQTGQGKVSFEPIENQDNDYIEHGYLRIVFEPLEKSSLIELLRMVKKYLEDRVPKLVTYEVSDNLIRSLKQRSTINFSLPEESNQSFEDVEINNDSDNNNDLGISFADESHIFDFWEEVSAYICVLEELKDTFNEEQFLDYSKDAMIAFLRPIVIVDGQHRLRAAISSAKNIVQESCKDKIEEAIINNEADPDEIQYQLEVNVARKLPISLLMNDDPAEQVFQFVVVNQKATPIKPALLGTIVSTSLSNEELERVGDRLESAGIKLEESRAVTFLARYPDSPFLDLVERGLTSDTKDRLQWNVLASIVRIFRELKGGKLFHDSVDYADKWKRSFLPESRIVERWEAENCQNAFEYWHQLNGCWRDVFISFWKIVSDKLSDKSNDEAWHYWGSPKQSNIFNKTSLTILAADFFQYLCERRMGIDNLKQIPSLVNEWLEDVNMDYFNRDWNLHGVKKDVPGIRKQWSKLWVEYRKDPQKLPRADRYRIPLG